MKVEKRQINAILSSICESLKRYEESEESFWRRCTVSLSSDEVEEVVFFFAKKAKMTFYDRDDNQWLHFFGKTELHSIDWNNLSSFFKQCRESFVNDIKEGYRVPVLMPFWGENQPAYSIVPEYIVEIRNNLLTVRGSQYSFREVLKGWIEKETSLQQIKVPLSMNIKRIDYQPSFEQWCHQVEDKIAKIKSNRLTKGVVYRKEIIELDEGNRINLFLKKFIQEKDDRFIYNWNLGADHFFLGATPELIYQRQGTKLKVEAVAGTATSKLLLQKKEEKEHEVVADFLEKKIEKLSEESIQVEHQTYVKSGNVYHFVQKMEINIKESVRDSDILHAIYPSPAIVDYLDGQRKCVSQTNRGLYSGLTILISADGVKSVLNIRCMDLKKNQLEIYAGAGIVVGSEADKEWLEVQRKVEPFKSELVDEKTQ